jgi:hypothetical protein
MAKKHLHKYKLRDLSRKTPEPYYVYICTHQDCSHNIRVELVEGKIAECNRCGDPFIMKLAKLKHGGKLIVRPHCDDCTKTPQRIKEKKKHIERSIDELMNSILP